MCRSRPRSTDEATGRARTDTKSTGLWDEDAGFYFDRLRLPDGRAIDLPVRSYVGLMAIAAATTLDGTAVAALPAVRHYLDQLTRDRPALAAAIIAPAQPSSGDVHLSLVSPVQLRRLLALLFDADEFLAPGGIRSLSKAHADNAVTLLTDSGETLSVSYEPGEGMTDLFGGNSNWRGPIWFPINYLLIDALWTLHACHGDAFMIDLPSGSGQQMTLSAAADDLSQRLIGLFRPGADGHVPWTGDDAMLADACHHGLHQFPEYFHGDSGRALGAAHQTGWTGLVACLLDQQARRTRH